MALCYDEALEWLNGDSTQSRERVAPGVLSTAAKLTVVVGGSRFSLKKSLLIRNCDYFRALYRSGMKECGQDEIHLKCLSPLGFLIALGVLRGARPMLDGDQLVEAIECAAFLQVSQLGKHLVDLVDSDNCLLMYHTAATFGLMELHHAAALYIRDMYLDLEAEVKTHLPPELVSYVESLSPSSLVAVGRHASCGIDETIHVGSRTVWHLDEDRNEWKALTDLPPEASTAMAGVTVLDNKLYVVGGVQGGGQQAAESCFCYSVESGEWSQIASLSQLRYNFSLVGHQGHLYAIGGEYGGQVMSSVEAYEVKTGRWTFTAHLPRAAVGAAWAKAMGRMFVCLWKPKDTTDIYEYLPGQDRWTLLTTLIRQQSYGQCMVGHRDNLYVMRNMRNDFLRCMIDCYSLTTGQWAALPGHFPNSKGALFTSVVRGDSVFTLNRTATLEYVIEGKEWRPTRRQMKGFPRSGSVVTFLLRLPKNHHSQQLATQRSGSQTISHQGPEHSLGDCGKTKQQEG